MQTFMSSLAARGLRSRSRDLGVPVSCKYAHAGVEPSLDEALQDPVVQLMMRADRLDLADVRRSLSAARERVSLDRVPVSAGVDPAIYRQSGAAAR